MTTEKSGKFREETVRDEKYVTAIPTDITLEEASQSNPFHTENMYIYGYEHLELSEKRNVTDMMFLLFSGELPDQQQKTLFDKLLCCLINPGPRHPATRAAMNTGIARTKLQHALPISLSVGSGSYLGSEDVFNAMHFLQKNIERDASVVVQELLAKKDFHVEENPLIAPGFGSFYGGADTYAQKLADFLQPYNREGKYFHFASELVKGLQEENKAIGWLTSGLTAAVLSDLGFHPRQGNVLFHIAIAPGLAAHAVEKANKPVTDMPFVSEDNYFIDESALAKPENRED